MPPFVRPNVLAMKGYAPGEQPRAGERIVKLNTNENPFPPSPRVMQAIRDVPADALRRYPDPLATRFRDAAAGVLNVRPTQILAGNGSDDILTIATRTFIPPGGRLAVCEPTYSLYPILAALETAATVGVPWADGWTLPTAALLEADADAIYLPNPNAPSGTLVPPAAVAELAGRFGKLVLVDEAYVDFADHTCLPLVATHENIVISRSLSKGYGLAGLRFGYAVAQESVIDQMLKVKDSYNCDALSIAAAAAAMEDQDHARASWDHVRHERGRLSEALAGLGFDVLPSQANFVLATAPHNSARDLYPALKRRGVLVRWFDQGGLRDKLRITIGTSEESDILLRALRGEITVG